MTSWSPGFWRPGDDPGDRRFVTLKGERGAGFDFEGGDALDEVTVAYETWGRLNDDASNAVLVLHALTGDSHAAGPVKPGHRTPGWWEGIIGPGRALDTDELFVVCPNVLGGAQGTTGPSSLDAQGQHLGSRFPVITIRDQVDVEVAFSEYLGIDEWCAVVGGSMGGMRALEWAVGHQSKVRHCVVIAVGAAATADQIALCSLQIRAIRVDPNFCGGDYYASGRVPFEGLAIARGLGQFSYRTGGEFESRFGRTPQGDGDVLRTGRYAIESYLGYHGHKLAARFDPNSYIVLSEAMNHHDVGRGRGGVAEALGGVSIPVTVAGVASDRLYPLAQQEQLVELLPNAEPLTVISSDAGHDGFLLEVEQIDAVLRSALHR
jgi:homoserine O-acetyltransferase